MRRGRLALALAALALPSCWCKCRKMVLAEMPLTKCVLYRHKEELPLDAAPFFDIYVDGQQPDSFAEVQLDKQLPFRAPLAFCIGFLLLAPILFPLLCTKAHVIAQGEFMILRHGQSRGHCGRDLRHKGLIGERAHKDG